MLFSARDCAVAYITTAIDVFPVEMRSEFVGARLRFGHCVTQRDGAQYATTIGHYRVVLQGRAGSQFNQYGIQSQLQVQIQSNNHLRRGFMLVYSPDP